MIKKVLYSVVKHPGKALDTEKEIVRAVYLAGFGIK